MKADTNAKPGTTVASTATSNRALPAQTLTFRLGAETFGIDILRVREIRGWTPVTSIPECPAYLLGVLNLRGTVVPVLDLRMRMAMPSAEHTATTVIIVVSVEVNGERRDVGLVVDAVSDVADVDARVVRPMPEVGRSMDVEYIQGLVASGDALVLLLDIDCFVGRDTSLPHRRAQSA